MLRDLTSTLQAIGAALVRVLLAMGSLASTIVALWVVASLARAALVRDAVVVAGGAWIWLVAIIVTLAVPLSLAAWKHRGDSYRLRRTMVWLPLLWNFGGLAIATQVIPDVIGSALRGHGAWVAADRVGDSRASTRVMSALGYRGADTLDSDRADHIGSTREGWTSERIGEVDHDRALSVPFATKGTILMDATLVGPRGTTTLPYLVDTGASFTTISTAAAAELGIVIPDDAPRMTSSTAVGPRESKVVFLPALRLGSVELAGLLVAVCDDCVNERFQGFLGHNVMREFFVQIDFADQRLVLLPRVDPQRANRALDIQEVVELRVDGKTEVQLGGRIRWVVRVHNRGTVPITGVVPFVRFRDGPVLRGKTIDELAPGAVGHSLVEGRAAIDGKGGSKLRYRLGLGEAFW